MPENANAKTERLAALQPFIHGISVFAFISVTKSRQTKIMHLTTSETVSKMSNTSETFNMTLRQNSKTRCNVHVAAQLMKGNWFLTPAQPWRLCQREMWHNTVDWESLWHNTVDWESLRHNTLFENQTVRG